MDLTWLGWTYIICVIIFMMLIASQVGNYTKSRRIGWSDVFACGIASALCFWAYATVGVVH